MRTKDKLDLIAHVAFYRNDSEKYFNKFIAHCIHTFSQPSC